MAADVIILTILCSIFGGAMTYLLLDIFDSYETPL
jgi:hypothetical protein